MLSYHQSRNSNQTRLHTTSVIRVVIVNLIPMIRLLKCGGGWLIPMACITRPNTKAMPRIAMSHSGASLSSRQAMSINAIGTYSAKLACARMARSKSSTPPLPRPTLCCRRRRITPNDRRRKSAAKIQAINVVTISMRCFKEWWIAIVHRHEKTTRRWF